MPCCEISDCAQRSKTIIAVRHFELWGRESLETAVKKNSEKFTEGTKSYYQLILKSGNNSAQDKST